MNDGGFGGELSLRSLSEAGRNGRLSRVFNSQKMVNLLEPIGLRVFRRSVPCLTVPLAEC